MEVPSFVTWSDLEKILKGMLMKPETDMGPSPALTDQMKTIGHLDKDVLTLGVNCQVLDVRTELDAFEGSNIAEDYPNQDYCCMSCLL